MHLTKIGHQKAMFTYIINDGGRLCPKSINLKKKKKKKLAYLGEKTCLKHLQYCIKTPRSSYIPNTKAAIKTKGHHLDPKYLVAKLSALD